MAKEQIIIISGEGTGPGTPEIYHGTGTDRAIKARLTRERCGGDRWARALVVDFTDHATAHGVDWETGEYRMATVPA